MPMWEYCHNIQSRIRSKNLGAYVIGGREGGRVGVVLADQVIC